MTFWSTPAVLLRLRDYGENDLIVTMFSRAEGKVTAAAKSAKKSRQRFGGSLELFALVDVVYRYGKKASAMPTLSEASSRRPHGNLRTDVVRTAYASLWSEMVDLVMEPNQAQEGVFDLLSDSLLALDGAAEADRDRVHLLFMMRFLSECGVGPNLGTCGVCHRPVAELGQDRFLFDPAKGALVCEKCRPDARDCTGLCVGTIKELAWMTRGTWPQASRVRAATNTVREGLATVEAFVPVHLGKVPRSLGFLKQIRRH